MHTVFVGKAEEKRPLRTFKHRWQYNIKMNFNQTGWRVMGWIHLPQDRDEWWVLMKMVINLRVLYNAGNFLNSCATIKFQRRSLPHQAG
jgi:hypothetical protein